MNEFTLIEHYFKRRTKIRGDVLLGIGDDCALLKPPSDQTLVTSMDTLVSGVHFPTHTSVKDIGYKSLAVSLSDLAAMGAEPAWVMLALTMPEENETWLADFCDGFFELCDHYGLQLVGGDTTRGPLSITTQVMGFVPANQALLRSGARAGDKIYVTGSLGGAGLGLMVVAPHQMRVEFSNLLKNSALQQSHVSPTACGGRTGGGWDANNAREKSKMAGIESALKRLNRPAARVLAGKALRGIASAAIDISDGLLADLGHILEASNAGATLHLQNMPLDPALENNVAQNNISKEQAYQLALSAGDDYELCFTVPKAASTQLAAAFDALDCGCHCIGVIEKGAGVRVLDEQGSIFKVGKTGYQHF